VNRSRNVALTLTALALSLPAGSALAEFPDGWTRDPSNPIAPTLGGFVLFHDGMYKAWGGLDGFDYATSPDGRVWTQHSASPVLVAGPEWYDVNEVANPAVAIVGTMYHMWYSGVGVDQDNRIAHATSPDGIEWTKDLANPVMNLGPPGSLDEDELIHPFVIREEPLYRMWYNGVGGSPSEQRILYAESLDGVAWFRDPDAALDLGNPGSWDDTQLYMMSVLRFADLYYMFYTASNTAQEFGIGYATSSDGIDWDRPVPSEPVLTPGDPGAWDDLGVARPVVLDTGSEFLMWYGGTRDFMSFSWGLATASYPTAAPVVAGRPDVLHVGSAWPNPTDGRVSLAVYSELEAAMPVEMDVVSVSGRRVWSGARTVAPGFRRIEWAGRDRAGIPVSPGAYFLRVRLGEEQHQRKVVIVR
jgi:hypothetical protein